jgi:hypothetical protein
MEGVPDCPHPHSKRIESYFSHVEMGLLTQQDCCCTANNLWASTSWGHRWVRWSSMQRLHRYFDFIFSMFPPPTLLMGFLSPLPFLFHCFFFPLGCWLAFRFINCTLCTSDVWVGGVAELEVWLDVVCYIDNCCNLFDNWSVEFTCVELTIPSTCGPNLCLALIKDGPWCIWKNIIE